MKARNVLLFFLISVFLSGIAVNTLNYRCEVRDMAKDGVLMVEDFAGSGSEGKCVFMVGTTSNPLANYIRTKFYEKYLYGSYYVDENNNLILPDNVVQLGIQREKWGVCWDHLEYEPQPPDVLEEKLLEKYYGTHPGVDFVKEKTPVPQRIQNDQIRSVQDSLQGMLDYWKECPAR